MAELHVTTGTLWRGRTWKEAIDLSLSCPDCGIEELTKFVNPNSLLDDRTVFDGYRIWGIDNSKRYTTRIPASMILYAEASIKRHESQKNSA